MTVQNVTRAFRFALDYTPDQEIAFKRHAGAARYAFNFALGLKETSHQAWSARRDEIVCELSGWSKEQLHSARRAKRNSETRKHLAGYQKQASESLKPEMAALSVDMQIYDHHRKVLFQTKSAAKRARELQKTSEQKEREAKAYAKLAEGNPALAAELENRRNEIFALQHSEPEKFPGAREEELENVRPKILAAKKDLITKGAHAPVKFDIEAIWRAQREKPREEGGTPWYKEVNPYAFLSGFERADTGWKNWVDSCAGKRKGRPLGHPRFKKKGKGNDSFTLYHNIKSPGIRLDGYRRLVLPTIGSVRLEQTNKRLNRLIQRKQAVISSVTIIREGHRWYASVLARVDQDIPVVWRHTDAKGDTTDYLTPSEATEAKERHGGAITQLGKPTARQRANGLVAVDLGVQPLAKLSAPLNPADPASVEFTNPKYLIAATESLKRAQRALSRCAPRSKNRAKKVRRLAKLHHEVAVRRKSYLHGVSKQLTTGAQYLALENLDLVKLTASARGTVEKPGTDVKLQAKFTQHLLDASLGELRRQIGYKGPWYGSTLIMLDKGEATSSKCSNCGERNPNSRPSDKRFTCANCGLDVDRRLNATRSIYKAARRKITPVAPGRGSTLKAPGGPVSPDSGDGGGHGSTKGEGPLPQGPADLTLW